jgi:hypothetical protein
MVVTTVATVVVSGLLTLFAGCSSSNHSSKSACIPARIGGQSVCLKPGVRCKPPQERVYRSYGLTCRKGVLRQRNYIGPANP